MKQQYYHITVAGCERELPLCPLNDRMQIAGFVLLGDPELTAACAAALLQAAPAYDCLITAEAKGIPLAHEMARQAGNQRYIVARKKPKLYMTGVTEVRVHYITTEGEQYLCLDAADAERMRGKRVLIVDDVISTGESLHALEALVEQSGGSICGRMAVLAEGDACLRRDLIFLERLPLFDAAGKPIGEIPSPAGEVQDADPQTPIAEG